LKTGIIVDCYMPNKANSGIGLVRFVMLTSNLCYG